MNDQANAENEATASKSYNQHIQTQTHTLLQHIEHIHMYTRLVSGGHANINRVYGALLTGTAEHSTYICVCVCVVRVPVGVPVCVFVA